ncbi:MAG: hypothetical protein AAF483_31125, partial [Planctomycetota bacterium]
MRFIFEKNLQAGTQPSSDFSCSSASLTSMRTCSANLSPKQANASKRTHHKTLITLLCLFMALTGCSGQQFLIRRSQPANPLTGRLQLDSYRGPKISGRTDSVLRRFALADIYNEDPKQCLEVMHELLESEVEAELVYG